MSTMHATTIYYISNALCSSKWHDMVLLVALDMINIMLQGMFHRDLCVDLYTQVKGMRCNSVQL